ncbi:MAG: D-arabinono-1,4-lactone oxidase [Actinomycetota bacterium]
MHEHRWTNWGGNQRTRPADVLFPTTEADLQRIVGRGVAERRKVKVVGSGHSFSGIAATDDLLVDVRGFRGLRGVDPATREVRVGAGTVLADLNPVLRKLGYALPNLGDIDRQTIAGAVATSTHGTGAGHGSISAAVSGARIVSGDGSVIEVDGTHRPDLLAAAQANLGALGILTEVTLRCERMFDLHAVETTHRIDELLDDFDAVADANEHVEFFWMPGTDLAMRKVNNRTERPVGGRGRAAAFLADEVVGNAVFGAVMALGRRRPDLVPKAMAAALAPGDRTEYVAPSHEVFCSARRVRFVEMEYAVPRAHLLEAFGRVRALVGSLAPAITFPIEVRVLGADDTAIGTASGRDSGYIAVHVLNGTEFEPYFRAVEAIMADYAGRPHWRKMHWHSAETLAPLYPGWDTFQAAVDELDPDGHFSNPYLDRVIRGRGFTSR